jgi:hypothetical protein
MPRRDKHIDSYEFGSGVPATASASVQRKWPKWLIILALSIGAGWALHHYNPELVERWLSKSPVKVGSSKTTVYKWRDARGEWHITDKPPEAPIRYKTLEYDSDTNVMPIAPEK